MYCISCGNQADDNAKFCSKCGAYLQVNINNSQQYQKENEIQHQSTGKKIFDTISTIIGMLIIGFGIFFAYIIIDDLRKIGSYDDIVANYNKIMKDNHSLKTSEEYYGYILKLYDLKVQIGLYTDRYRVSLQNDLNKTWNIGEMYSNIEKLHSLLKETEDIIKSYITKYENASNIYELQQCIEEGDSIYNNKKNIIDLVQYFKSTLAKQYTTCSIKLNNFNSNIN